MTGLFVDGVTPLNAANFNKLAPVDARTKVPLANLPLTVGALAAGPPAAPQDGDMWSATNVDANSTRWHFQYNAGSASPYKWEFIGGPPLSVLNSSSFTLGNSPYTTEASFTLARAGDYRIASGNFFGSNGNAASTLQLGVGVNGTIQATLGEVVATGIGYAFSTGGIPWTLTLAAGQVINVMCSNTTSGSAAANCVAGFALVPVRIS